VKPSCGGGQLTELLDAVFALEALAFVDALGALVKVVLERSTCLGLLALLVDRRRGLKARQAEQNKPQSAKR
jgi:hypothetical protein